MDTELHARVGPSGRTVPALLDRRSDPPGKNRELRRHASQHNHPNRLRRTLLRTVGDRALPASGRSFYRTGRSGMVRWYLGTPAHRHRRLATRRPRHSPWPQPARRRAHHREPVADDLPPRRVPHQQNASLLPLRDQSTRSRKSAHRVANRPRLQCHSRSREDRITNSLQTNLRSRITLSLFLTLQEQIHQSVAAAHSLRTSPPTPQVPHSHPPESAVPHAPPTGPSETI